MLASIAATTFAATTYAAPVHLALPAADPTPALASPTRAAAPLRLALAAARATTTVASTTRAAAPLHLAQYQHGAHVLVRRKWVVQRSRAGAWRRSVDHTFRRQHARRLRSRVR